jgi:lysyl-tRNA synthetase class 1
MRWYALGVDYEMAGKDLIDSVTLSSKIVKVLGGMPPAGFSYELFLDQEGRKISKSKGNGLSVEEWLRYGSPESLALFMYGQPKRAKRLYFDSIPKAVDEYFSHQQKLDEQEDALKLENPAFHISLKSTTDAQDMPVSFSLLLNLAGVCSADTTDELWGYISAYAEGADKQSHPHLEALARYAVAYYQDRVRPHKTYRRATEAEKQRITELRDNLAALGDDASAEEVQSAVFAAGRDHYEQLRDWFSCLYQTMLGQDQGPRMGSFFRLYGLKPSIALCDDVLTDRLV